jgi:hypothetical protein
VATALSIKVLQVLQLVAAHCLLVSKCLLKAGALHMPRRLNALIVVVIRFNKKPLKSGFFNGRFVDNSEAAYCSFIES